MNAAVSFAQSSDTEKIVLISNGTLPAGSYTITSGRTLLIPFDVGYTLVKGTPTVVYNEYATPTAFRELTMANGASITINSGGAISCASKLSSKGQMGGYNGTPTGPDGRIKMNTGSTITVKSGGNLYVWGYIHGSGSISAESGATVYEAFQIKDWRGGTATSSVRSYAFIFNQYYIQNVEVPMTLYAGAKEKLYSAANASSAAYTMDATFLGSDGLFNISSGYMIKDYIESEDRLQMDIYGSASIQSMTISGLPVINSISTSGYRMPINSNITINIHSGTTTVSQDIEMLPSVEVSLDSGANLSISSGKKIYLFDNDDWTLFSGQKRLYVVGYSVANGTTAKRTDATLIDSSINVNGTMTVAGKTYTSLGGAHIFSSEGTGKIIYSTAFCKRFLYNGALILNSDKTTNGFYTFYFSNSFSRTSLDISCSAPVTSGKTTDSRGSFVIIKCTCNTA